MNTFTILVAIAVFLSSCSVNAKFVTNYTLLDWGFTDFTIEEMDLDGMNIKGIESTAFKNYVNLKRLDLTDNNVENLDSISKSFEFLGNLEYLNLGENLIKSIPAEAFSKLRNLKELMLYGLSLTSFKKNTFLGLDKLEGLDLDYNRLETIDRDTFNGIKSTIKHLNLGTNRLTRLDDFLFADFSVLETLKFRKNELEFISPTAFNGLTGLQKLDLSLNKLTALPLNGFESLNNLESLTLYSNRQLTSLQADAFKGLENLQVLNLRESAINQTHLDAFASLGNLKKLTLEDSKLRLIPADIFLPLRSLEVLKLRKNEIASIQAGGLNGLDNLQTLDMSFNIRMASVDTNAWETLGKLEKVCAYFTGYVEDYPELLSAAFCGTRTEPDCTITTSYCNFPF